MNHTLRPFWKRAALVLTTVVSVTVAAMSSSVTTVGAGSPSSWHCEEIDPYTPVDDPDCTVVVDIIDAPVPRGVNGGGSTDDSQPVDQAGVDQAGPVPVADVSSSPVESASVRSDSFGPTGRLPVTGPDTVLPVACTAIGLLGAGSVLLAIGRRGASQRSTQT